MVGPCLLAALCLKAEGCIDTCAVQSDDPDGICDTSGCHGKLRTKKDLEDVRGGPEWRRRHEEMLEDPHGIIATSYHILRTLLFHQEQEEARRNPYSMVFCLHCFLSTGVAAVAFRHVASGLTSSKFFHP
eukprot:g8001.t1